MNFLPWSPWVCPLYCGLVALTFTPIGAIASSKLHELFRADWCFLVYDVFNAASLLFVIGLIVGAFYSFGLSMGLVSFALAMPTVRFAHGLSLPFASGIALSHRLHELSVEPSDQRD